MAKLKVELKGDDTVDNAVIYLNDPAETIPYYLSPDSDTDWSKDDIGVPMGDDDPLAYSLHVVAFSGTKFTCTITNKDNDKTIVIKDVTGKIIKNRADSKGSKKFS